MFVVWSGFGFLAFLIPIALVLAGQFGMDAMLGGGWYAAHKAVAAVLLLIAAALVWIVGVKLNSDQGRLLIDPNTQEQVVFKRRHTIFWIPMQWASAFIAAVAVIQLMK
ncbi:membrane protein [Pseudomonas oryzihabitans]|nr:membrane protein [Pseudomonas psychrotolerans]